MSKVNARIVHHRISTDKDFEPAPNSDFEEFNGWTEFDLADGEIGVNLHREKVYANINGNIKQITTGDGAVTIGTTAITSGTNDRILYQSGGVVQQNLKFTYNGSTLSVQAGGALSTDIPFKILNSSGTVSLIEQRGDGSFTQKDSGGVNRINLTATDSYFLKDGHNFIQFGSENRIYSGSTNLQLITGSGRIVFSYNSVNNYTMYKGSFQVNTTFQDPGTATNTMIFENGVAPSANLANHFWMYSADQVAGNAAPHFRTENGSIIKIYQETTGVGSATLTGGGGTTLTDTDTFDGYTLKQIVKALRNQGLLA